MYFASARVDGVELEGGEGFFNLARVVCEPVSVVIYAETEPIHQISPNYSLSDLGDDESVGDF